MNDTPQAIDLGLRIPLQGVQLIEASAGTGKTFTLATLVSRLVIERGLPVSAILAVTYTVAASEELRERLRQRLSLAARLAAGEPEALAAAVTEEEARLTLVLVEAAAARDGADALQRRLRLQAQSMDLAPVFTIHGFCARALADHALEAGQPPSGRELLANERALREEVAVDLWRMLGQDPSDAAALRARWGEPAALARALPDLLAADELRPPPPLATDDGKEIERDLDAARGTVRAQFEACGAAAWDALDAAMTAGVMNGNRFRRDSVRAAWQSLADWVAGGTRGAPEDDRVTWLATPQLRDRAIIKRIDEVPASPLFDALAQWATAAQVQAAQRAAGELALVHRVCVQARARLSELKRQRGLHGYDDLIEDVADALQRGDGERFAQRLQAQYRVALVDEFQDTDARQWAIFRRLFVAPAEADPADGPRALFLIGDPKQAIYRFRGGDVNTYLAAAETADARHALDRNFRSRARVLDAVEALFERAGEQAFAEPRIRFQPVVASSGLGDAALVVEDAAAPGLTVLTLGPDSDRGELTVDAARTQAAAACVQEIAALLRRAEAGRARLTSAKGHERPLRAGDIAVLVERHEDGERMQQALANAGIPAVTAGRRSLFSTDQAQDLRRLLASLLAPGDESRRRAALATPLLGFDASDLLALTDDPEAQRQVIDRLQALRERWERHGPLAMLNPLIAREAPRLLGLVDGERRLTNYLQLAELLQADSARALGAAGLLDALERRIGEADEQDEAQQLRLESDAARVKILTLHKSKGLQFPLVFLPFAATGGRGGVAREPVAFHEGTRRIAVLKDDPAYKDAQQREQVETLAEKLRLLYVGLTRAEHAVWIAWGAVNGAAGTALGWLLHQRDGKAARALDASAIAQALADWQAAAPQAVAVRAADTAVPTRLPATVVTAPPPPRQPRRAIARDWWVHSFSQLARADASGGQGERGAEDEPPAPEPMLAPSHFSGARFGNVLHAALEHADFARWHGLEDAAPTEEIAQLERALRGEGYATPGDLQAGVVLLARLMRHTLNLGLPEGLRLCELPRTQRRDEMEFHLALAATRVDEALALLHAHGIVRERRGFGLRERLEGLLTGKIDLVYAHAGRYYLLDYKSNQLPAYDADSVAAAMAESEYDLQYVLYTLALHRWLRFRLGAGYDYDTHLGGVRYLFCRGLDATRADSPGVFATRPPRALVEGLDALFAGAGVPA